MTNANTYVGRALQRHDSDDVVLGEADTTEPEANQSSGIGVTGTKGSRKGGKKTTKGQVTKVATSRAQSKKAKKSSAPESSITRATDMAAAASAATALASAPESGSATAPVDAVVSIAAATAASDTLGKMALSPSLTQSPSQAERLEDVPYPLSPKTLSDLPSTLSELARRIPEYDAPMLDTVDPETEDAIVHLMLAAEPDFIAFVLLNHGIIKTHHAAHNEQDHPWLWHQLQICELMLDWYLLHYSQLGRAKGAFSKHTEHDIAPMDVDMSELHK